MRTQLSTHRQSANQWKLGSMSALVVLMLGFSGCRTPPVSVYIKAAKVPLAGTGSVSPVTEQRIPPGTWLEIGAEPSPGSYFDHWEVKGDAELRFAAPTKANAVKPKGDTKVYAVILTVDGGSEVCSSCTGTGFIQCPKCHGRGSFTQKLRCGYCDGKGYTRSILSLGFKRDCGACEGGTQTSCVDCTDCIQGKKPCADCLGRGVRVK